MANQNVSRRRFFGASAFGAAAGVSALADPGRAAAQSVGIKPADLPDLTIKEVKVYVLGREKLAAIVTNSGIEGNYTLADHYWHSNWSNLGWLEYTKRLLKGKSALDLPAITSQWEPDARRVGQSGFASAIDCCLWDILGKAVGLPVYRILGAYKDKVLAYASSQHLKTVEEYIPDVMRAKSQGFKAYKIHPGPGQHAAGGKIPAYVGHMEEIKTIRKAVGDDFILMHDPVGVYTREEAIKVGRLLDQLGYVTYEDPLPTKDIEGLVDLTRAVDVPVHIGEFIVSPYDFAEYVRRGAMDVVRFIVDYVGGITGGMKVARMAECFGMECAPHNWGGPLEHAVHFHCELASPNCYWFEMTQPQGNSDRPYIKDPIRIDDEGYVHAPAKPGLGYEVDRAALDKLIKKIES
jgi:L-alanine-DL-glutamate epimerase-like enolase superfamily enzyme